MTTCATELWVYLDAITGQQKGPVTASILKKLLRKGIVQPQQLVWTPHLSEWDPIARVEPLAAYSRVWTARWYFMAEQGANSSAQAAPTGPVTTEKLVQLFVDGEIDGMTLVWTEELEDWKPIGEVSSLKEFIQEANDEMDREEELQEQTNQVPMEHQVFETELGDALVAEDGTQYVFDPESKTYVTPEQKIQEDLASLQESMMEINSQPEKSDHLSVNSNDDVKVDQSEESSMSIGTTRAMTKGQTIVKSNVGAIADADAAKKRKKKKKKKGDKWKKSKKNTWVYVNGLPLDITIQEVHDHFAKCGVIQSDIASGEPRIKLYQNKECGGLNGDGSVCYMKEASVELAVQLLDKSSIRPEWTIDVSPAEFKQKGEEFVKQKKQKVDPRAKIKLFEKEKALSWNESDVDEPAGLRIVVIKHMFTPAEIEDEANEKELLSDIQDECSKIGEVAKITLFAKHVEGVVAIKFSSSGSAARCVEVMNGRFFAGRKLECGFWDGTDYTHHESKDEEKERAVKFQEWLDEGSSSSDSEAENEEQTLEPDERAGNGNGFHARRACPAVTADRSVSNRDANDKPHRIDEVHAGRIMPDLDAVDSDD
ncbi:hypothetical protein PsorP6_001966 [Peronosclerospora sorghi]|uniref:Uncharacterized protein n=1 Tax=Peronosclerospora sorghi TaxID=230839 RepID=A0ACC0WWF1_9STRA|nr:hypothetical protein PsorP6_001966 [Peronosclerospora sorghi]